MKHYWEDLNGRIACYEHIGRSAQGWIDQGKTNFSTDLTSWVQLSESDVADFTALMAEYDIHGDACEDCRDARPSHDAQIIPLFN